MTDFTLPGGHSHSNPTSTIMASSPPKAAGRNRLATAALGCVVLFFVALVAAVVLHPNIPGALLIILAALPVAAVTLGVMSRRKVRRVGRRRGNIAVTVGVVLVVLVLGVSILLPSLCRPREAAYVAKCSSNMKNICAALYTYADAHNGEYPPSLDALITDPSTSGFPSSIYVCPASLDSPATGNTPEEIVRNMHAEPFHQSYVYIPPTAATLAGDGVIVYEHPHNHRHSHLNVLFRSGEVRFLNKKEAEALIPNLAKEPEGTPD